MGHAEINRLTSVVGVGAGPVMVPILLAAGFSPVTAGALLLIGASMGGELFNPGAVEVVTLANLIGRAPTDVVRLVMPANLVASVVALAVFWRLAIVRERE